MTTTSNFDRRQFLNVAARTTAGMLFAAGGGRNSLVLAASPDADALSGQHKLTPKPSLGWNSYDCLGSGNEESLMGNIEAFITRLKPFGYEYFVIDIGWFDNGDDEIMLDEYGRYMPAPKKFPSGFAPLVEKCHASGIKFGIWMMRGVSKKAYELNLPIKGTNHTVRDITDMEHPCTWGYHNYGVDMSKPGAQEYYDSLAEPFAEWKIDFVKYDDMVPHPREIEAAVKSIHRLGRPIVISLSPGDQHVDGAMDIYEQTNMLRITGDVWDKTESLQKCFERWEKFQNYGGNGFWIDLDMISFGHFTRQRRYDNFTRDQKLTFMTQRALAASPLFMGGDLRDSDELSFQLIAHAGMLECNQNGVTGKLVARQEKIDVWGTPDRTNKDSGWVGIFNRDGENLKLVKLSELELGLKPDKKYKLHDVWADAALPKGLDSCCHLAPDGAAFLKYSL